MLIECPECKRSVSSEAATCPHCGISIAGSVPASGAKRVQAQKPFKQWARFFLLMALVGLLWPLFRAPDVTPLPGPIFLICGVFGWLAMKWRIWFYTDDR